MDVQKKNRMPPPDATAMLQTLTTQDFLNFGLGHIAYIRPVSDDGDGAAYWGIFAADGTMMAAHENPEEAVLAARKSNLRPISVQ
ncbi:MAG: hypothetical protein HY370_00110 [Proteobacteria bacterium]|nr:hypothetical protein [Pseudomonadota bacterium]